MLSYGTITFAGDFAMEIGLLTRWSGLVFPLVDLLEKWGRMEEYLHSGVSVSSSRTRQARSRGDTNHLGRYEFLMGFTYEFI